MLGECRTWLEVASIARPYRQIYLGSQEVEEGLELGARVLHLGLPHALAKLR